MSRPLRWQIWVPRLLLVGVVLLAAQYVLGLAARSIAIRSGLAVVGADVAIKSSRVSLLNRQVVLNDLHIANRRKPSENVLEADRCELEIAPQPLLQKQTVVNRGRLSGLRIVVFGKAAAVRVDGVTEATSPTNWFQDSADVVAGQWFAHLAERLKQNSTGRLESVQRTAAFCASWSGQSAALEARGQDLSEQATKLRHDADAAEANPLRNDKYLGDLPQQIAALQQEFADLSAELEKLPDQLEAERRAIVAARRREEQLVDQQLKLEPIEADAISAYLLREAAAKPLDELLAVLRWVRETVPAESANRRNGRRGEDIVFAGAQAKPNLLVRALELQGSARIASQPVELRGLLTDLTTMPARHTEPMRLKLQTSGSLPVELQATIDRTRGVLRDALRMDCQGIVLPTLALGRSDQVAMTIGPSVGSLSVSVAVDGDKLTGEIQMVQKNVRIMPAVGGGFAGVPVAAALEESLGRIDSLATRVSLGGTLAEPNCTLWSNLGPAVAEAMERAVQRTGGQQARALMVEAGRQSDEQLTGIERQMTEQQSRWTTRIADVRAQLQTVVASDVSPDRLSPDRFGRRLPSNSLFR
jgi:uncharacterized protein (TIGR03545 family)